MTGPAPVKKSVLANLWTFACPYLEVTYRDQVLAKGSGFLWKQDERTFLVSNWHIFREAILKPGNQYQTMVVLRSHLRSRAARMGKVIFLCFLSLCASRFTRTTCQVRAG
jgi:hypothetical protein